MSAVADKLREARALVAKGWCQHVFARDERGYVVNIYDSKATCFCSMGAIYRAYGPKSGGDYYAAFDILEKAVRRTCVADWNDVQSRKPAQVLAAFDKAIELAEAQDA